MGRKLGYLLQFLLAICQLYGTTVGEAIAVNPKNFVDIFHSNELVLILFYKQTCVFSTNFLPFFDAAAHQLRLSFGGEGKVTLGKVDCGAYPNAINKFNVGKYPTVRIVRFGMDTNKEYRGRRSTEAIIQFVYTQLRDPIEEFHTINDLQSQPNQKFLIIGYFEHKDTFEYQLFRKTAFSMRDYCHFHVTVGESAKSLNPSGANKITFIRNLAHGNVDFDNEYPGSMTKFSELLSWLQTKCDPPVRELTFDNAEEISEEGRPFVILFYKKNDLRAIHEFENVIETELMDELGTVNFLTADGKKFAHPLYHLGKSEEDLPLIAIDSFEHMYLFPNFEDIHISGRLKEFIRSLFSGQLHIAYHLLEDSAETTLPSFLRKDQIDNDSDSSQEEIQNSTSPKPINKSKFKALLPSKKRYSFNRVEL